MKSLPVARIKIAKSLKRDLSIYDYIFLPDTNRGPYKDEKLADNEISELQKANSDKAILLSFYRDEEEVKSLNNYILNGAEIESSIQRIY